MISRVESGHWSSRFCPTSDRARWQDGQIGIAAYLAIRSSPIRPLRASLRILSPRAHVPTSPRSPVPTTHVPSTAPFDVRWQRHAMYAGVGIFHEDEEMQFSLTPLGKCLTSDHLCGRRAVADSRGRHAPPRVPTDGGLLRRTPDRWRARIGRQLPHGGRLGGCLGNRGRGRARGPRTAHSNLSVRRRKHRSTESLGWSPNYPRARSIIAAASACIPGSRWL